MCARQRRANSRGLCGTSREIIGVVARVGFSDVGGEGDEERDGREGRREERSPS